MLEWYVLRLDFNTGKLVKYNVFSKEDVDTIRRLRKLGKIQHPADLREWLKTRFMSQYWSRTEYEMLVSPLFKKTDEQEIKIDIWDQLEPNLDNITKYVIYTLGFRYK